MRTRSSEQQRCREIGCASLLPNDVEMSILFNPNQMPLSVQRALALDNLFVTYATGESSTMDRRIVCQWLLEVCSALEKEEIVSRMQLTTWSLAVKLFDVITSRRDKGIVQTSDAQALACASLDIAYKICPDQETDWSIFSVVSEWAAGGAAKKKVDKLQATIVSLTKEALIWPNVVDFVVRILEDMTPWLLRSQVHQIMAVAVQVTLNRGTFGGTSDLDLAVSCIRSIDPTYPLPDWMPPGYPSLADDVRAELNPTMLATSARDEPDVEAWLCRTIDDVLAPAMSTSRRQKRKRCD